MFHENLKNGPKYNLTKNEAKLARKTDYGKFLNEKIGIESLFARGTIIFAFLFLLGSLLLQGLLTSIDVITTLIGKADHSKLYNFYFEDLSTSTTILYYLHPIFIILTFLFTAFAGIRFYRNAILGRSSIPSHKLYLFNLITSIRNKDPSVLDRFIKFDEKGEKYQMVGFFSTADPLKCHSAMVTVPLSHIMQIIVLSFWIFVTGFINGVVVMTSRILTPTTDVLSFLDSISEVTRMAGFVGTLGGCMFFIMTLREFFSFLNEIIGRQEEYVSDLVVNSALPDDTIFLLELQQAKSDLKIYRSYYRLPLSLLIWIVTSTIPLVVSLI